MRSRKKKKLIYSLLVAAIMVIAVFLAWPAKKIYQVSNSKPAAAAKQSQPAAAADNKQQYPIDTASSLWVVINKGRALPSDYVPANLVTPSVPLRQSTSSSEMHLRSEAASALETMFAAAKNSGINLKLASGYRSYSEQVSVYGGYVSTSGRQQADTFSARPGHSEHQTGLAVDIEPLDRTCEVEQCFETTPEGKWLAAHAYQFGFIIRYQKTTQALTGYEYEPWHVRFVGNELAQNIYASGQTLEQYFSLPTYTDYPSQSLILKE